MSTSEPPTAGACHAEDQAVHGHDSGGSAPGTSRRTRFRLRRPRVPSVPGYPRVRNYAPWMVSGAAVLPDLPIILMYRDLPLLLGTCAAAVTLLLLRRFPWPLTVALICASALSRMVFTLVPFWWAAGLAPIILLSIRKVYQAYTIVIGQLLVASFELWTVPEMTQQILMVYAVTLGISMGCGLALYRPQLEMDRLEAHHRDLITRQRHRYGRIIHDGLARRVTHMVLAARRVRDMIDAEQDPESAAIADDIIATGERCLLRLREMMHMLKEDDPDRSRFSELFPHRRTPPLPPDPPHRSRRDDPLPWLPAQRLPRDPPEPPFIANPQWEPLHPQDDTGDGDGEEAGTQRS